MVQEANITIDHPCEHDPLYLHGPVGAYLAQKQFGVTAAPVLEAIRVHSTFAQTADMDFAWRLRFADLLAPSQGCSVLENRMQINADDADFLQLFVLGCKQRKEIEGVWVITHTPSLKPGPSTCFFFVICVYLRPNFNYWQELNSPSPSRP